MVTLIDNDESADATASPRWSQGEAKVSVRLLWPFTRVAVPDQRIVKSLRDEGLQAADFASPETRISHVASMRLLACALSATGVPALGLRAGEVSEPGDLDVVEYAARSRESVGEALAYFARYQRLLHDAVEVFIRTEGTDAVVCHRITDGVPQLPAANEYALAFLLGFLRRNAPELDENLVEVRFLHSSPSYRHEYPRVFGRAALRFDAGCNAVVLRREFLDAPTRHSNPRLARAFQLRAEQLLSALRQGDGVAGRVREIVMARGIGEITMEFTAARLGMSVATLRRRLEGEGTTFSEVINGVRKALAERHLREGSSTVSEVAFRLGFSSTGAFHKAFKRWTGVAPTAYRSRKRIVVSDARLDLVG